MRNPFKLVRFYFLNDRWSRETLRRWKKEGRIPEDYSGSLSAIAFWVELEESKREREPISNERKSRNTGLHPDR
jgi:hypothetical protein